MHAVELGNIYSVFVKGLVGAHCMVNQGVEESFSGLLEAMNKVTWTHLHCCRT